MTKYPLSDEEYFSSLVNKTSVIKNSKYLSLNFIPPHLPHREGELRTLARYYHNIFNELDDPAKKTLITGPIGSGKTSLAKKFGKMLESIDKQRKLVTIYINCRIYKSPYLIINTVARTLTKSIPIRGYSFEELQSLLIELLNSYKIRILLILDEIDYFVTRIGTDFFYDLLRIGEMTTHSWISYIFIARNLNFLTQLDESTKSSFKSHHIPLESYSESNLVDIIKSRVEIAFYKDGITDDSIALIADIASKSGDARYAIELLWGAGNCADDDSSPIVYPDHVRKAKSLIQPELRREIINGLNKQQSLVLLAIIRRLKHTKNAYISTSDIIESYILICEEYVETPRKHTQVWAYLKELSQLDIISTKLSGEGMRGKTTLVSIPDVSVIAIEQFLLQKMTFDVADECITGE